MGMRINTNLSSMVAQRALSAQTKRQQHASQALATGQRIVQASDDPAGLAISENLKSELRSSNQAKMNAQSAISLSQVGEGSLSEMSNLVTRLRELSVQSASDTISDKERSYLQQETKSLTAELDRIAKTTKFGNSSLLDGSRSDYDFHIGSGSGKDNVIKFQSQSNVTAAELDLESASVASKSDAVDLIEKTDAALAKIAQSRSSFGSLQSRMESVVNTLDIKEENLSSTRSRILDADMAKEASELASSTVLQNASASILAQANNQPMLAMKLIG
jgi:flagellin